MTTVATSDTLAAARHTDGFVRLPGTQLRDALGAGVATSWPAFSASWTDLPLDGYTADGGRRSC